MVRIGMFLGDRYEILEKIGSGGMAEVFKGKDHKLNRFVAVKVLKDEFVEDKNFVRKFKEEAQAAAALVPSEYRECLRRGRRAEYLLHRHGAGRGHHPEDLYREERTSDGEGGHQYCHSGGVRSGDCP